MQTETNDACTAEVTAPISKKKRLAMAASSAVVWLSERLALAEANDTNEKPRRLAIALICASVFFIALGVRLLHRQDREFELVRKGSMLRGLMNPYKHEAARMLEEGRVLFPRGPTDPGNAQMLVHPPGYSIFLAALIKIESDPNALPKLAQTAQIICDSIAAIAVFFIAAELLPLIVAFIASLLVAFSPHLAYYSLYLSPDSLSVLPVLVAVYLIIRARKHPRLILMIAAGALVGLSCWLRSNAILLAPFLAVVVWLLFERGTRLRYFLALTCATAIVIAPITIRNWVEYHSFIPLTVASGLNLVQGIAEFDTDDRFGMPLGDAEAKQKDIEWHNKPEYAEGLWKPDGIARDRYRFARGLEVIRKNPAWFAGNMARRAVFMLSYNDWRSHSWPFYTAVVPAISAEPSFGHWRADVESAQVTQASSPAEALTDGVRLSPESEISITVDGNMLEVRGDLSEFENQFAFPPIQVRKNTDYALQFFAKPAQGNMAARVTSADQRTTLTSTMISNPQDEKRKKKIIRGDDLSEADGEWPAPLINLRFASGNRTEVRLVITNNGASSARPIADIGEVRLLAFGPTPQEWTRYVRPLARGVQKNLYSTSRMLPLIIVGIALLAIANRRRALLLLLAIPIYYVCSHSAFSTEYRYVLAIHYFLFIAAATTLYCIAALIRQCAMALNRERAIEVEKKIASGIE